VIFDYEKMNKKIKKLPILIIFIILLISNINATSFENITTHKDQIYGSSNYNKTLLNNGIIFGRTIMTINSNPCGSLEFVNITFKGEETKKTKSGLFGFFIVRIPIGKYFVVASKYGFHDAYTNVMLFRFKPFVIITLKLEKRGWNIQ